jgi:GNAT superfamily N-acetyltransferase
MIVEQDIEEAIKLGYQINMSAKIAVQRINQFFAGIELPAMLLEFENLLDWYTEPPAYKQLIIKSIPEPYFQIIYLSSNYIDENKGLTLSRIFRYEQSRLIVDHHYFVLPENARGRGLGKKVLAACLDQYLNMNVKEIHVHAGLKDGGLVWAKMGFKALNKHEVENILQCAEKILAGTVQNAEELELVSAILKIIIRGNPTADHFLY